jgi:hypothetical protein
VTEVSRTIFLFFKFNFKTVVQVAHMTHVWYIPHMTFHSLPFAPRKIVATEARLNKIYDAAKLGLKGDALALASGMLPTEYRQLCELDPIADMAAQKGKADGELEMSLCLHKAAQEGDAKAALAILQHSHGWVAKQSISIDVDQRISIIGALRQAESRVIDVIANEPSPKLTRSDNEIPQETSRDRSHSMVQNG